MIRMQTVMVGQIAKHIVNVRQFNIKTIYEKFKVLSF